MVYVIGFPTITDAMATDALAKESDWKGELINIPPFLKAGCGFAFYVENLELKMLTSELEKNHIRYEKIVPTTLEEIL